MTERDRIEQQLANVQQLLSDDSLTTQQREQLMAQLGLLEGQLSVVETAIDAILEPHRERLARLTPEQKTELARYLADREARRLRKQQSEAAWLAEQLAALERRRVARTKNDLDRDAFIKALLDYEHPLSEEDLEALRIAAEARADQQSSVLDVPAAALDADVVDKLEGQTRRQAVDYMTEAIRANDEEAARLRALCQDSSQPEGARTRAAQQLTVLDGQRAVYATVLGALTGDAEEAVDRGLSAAQRLNCKLREALHNFTQADHRCNELVHDPNASLDPDAKVARFMLQDEYSLTPQEVADFAQYFNDTAARLSNETGLDVSELEADLVDRISDLTARDAACVIEGDQSRLQHESRRIHALLRNSLTR